MKRQHLLSRLREIIQENIPLPGCGQTSLRHQRLMEAGREDLSLARLAEAHWDAVAILAEADRESYPGSIYGVWAAEIPGDPIRLTANGSDFYLNGSKMFCSGAGIADRALVTVSDPEQRLVEIDLRRHAAAISLDNSAWKTHAFRETGTASAIFSRVPVSGSDLVGGVGWYLERPGFWHGACGPAACWAGGAAGLADFALRQRRDDPHTVAHLGAMESAVWAMQAFLHAAGREIDADPNNATQARIRARIVRHLIEQSSTDILRRLARAYGPYPLAMDEEVSQRYQELDLYLRQCHAERDLEALGLDMKNSSVAKRGPAAGA